MLALYLGTAACGVVLMVVSMLLGSDSDVDADVDMDVDLDLDMDVDMDVDLDSDLQLDHGHGGLGLTSWLPIASARFWTFLVMTFGLTGTGLTLLSVPWIITLAVAIVVGGAMGWSAAAVFRRLLNDTVSATTELSGLVGKEGTVVVRVRQGARGKIAVQTASGRLEMFAVSGDGRDLARGERVLLASIQQGVADVTSLEPERLRARPVITEKV